VAKRAFLIGAVALVALTGCGAGKTATPATTVVVPLRQFGFLFPEGYTRAQMAQRVDLDVAIAKAKLRRAHTPGRFHINGITYGLASRNKVVPCFGRGVQQNLEGFLFPARYDFDVKTTGPILVSDQLSTFCRNWRTLDLAYAHSKNLTNYDVLKIASMIEEEAAVPGDRAKIAAVIYNRLRARMPLGIDATLRYGLHIPPTQSITQAELASDNPYNTRKLYGLPPTPIGNPGLASLRAAAHPAKVGYLYYVRIPGTVRHKFFEDPTAYEQYLSSHGYGPHS
jgi:cell division protein YceG involved in septum cleavage